MTAFGLSQRTLEARTLHAGMPSFEHFMAAAGESRGPETASVREPVKTNAVSHPRA